MSQIKGFRVKDVKSVIQLDSPSIKRQYTSIGYYKKP